MNKTKKRALIILVSAAALTVLLLLNAIDWQGLSESVRAPEGTVKENNVEFYEPDYDSDIFEDSSYLDKNRYLSYTEGALTTLITDGNYLVHGEGVELIAKYIGYAVDGDAESINGLFTEAYFEDNPRYERFAPQKIYNAECELLSSDVIESGEYAGVTRYTYNVKYMILRNDGTFRSDMGSDAARAQIFEILKSSSGVLINSITPYTYLYTD